MFPIFLEFAFLIIFPVGRKASDSMMHDRRIVWRRVTGKEGRTQLSAAKLVLGVAGGILAVLVGGRAVLEERAADAANAQARRKHELIVKLYKLTPQQLLHRCGSPVSASAPTSGFWQVTYGNLNPRITDTREGKPAVWLTYEFTGPAANPDGTGAMATQGQFVKIEGVDLIDHVDDLPECLNLKGENK
jgi:hypothetical protein